VPAAFTSRRCGDFEEAEVVEMTPNRGTRRRALEPALSDERRRLIYRYMEEGVAIGEDELELGAFGEPPQEVEAAGQHLAEATVTRLPTPEPYAAPANGDAPRARRGRPPGRKARRQVHFHVDAEQDRMLLAAAGRFGSQQKALIAALQSLDEAVTLRRQVELLQAECERQRRLLAEAQALFKASS
jgi:hypothetical protein